MDIINIIIFVILWIYVAIFISLFIYEYRFKSKLFEKYSSTKYLGGSTRQRLIFGLFFVLLTGASIYLFFLGEAFESWYVTVSFFAIIFDIIIMLFVYTDLNTMAIITSKELVLIVKRKEYYRIKLASMRYYSVHRKRFTATYRFFDSNYKEVYATDEGFDHMDYLFNACHCKYIENRHDERNQTKRIENRNRNFRR